MKHLRKEKKKKAPNEDDKPAAPAPAPVWMAMDQRRASLMNLSRDGDTPLITGQGPGATQVDNELALALAEEEMRPTSTSPLLSHSSDKNGSATLTALRNFEGRGSAGAGSSLSAPSDSSSSDDDSSSSNSNSSRKKRDPFNKSRGDDDKRGAGNFPTFGLGKKMSSGSVNTMSVSSEGLKRDDSDSSDQNSTEFDEDDPRAKNTPARGNLGEASDMEDGHSISESTDAPGETTDAEAQAESDQYAMAEEMNNRLAEPEPVMDDDDVAPEKFGDTGMIPPSRETSVPDADSAKIIAESQETLMEILKTPAGKKKYMTWLFKLADASHRGRVNVEELAMILKALSMDGLAMSELVFDEMAGQKADYMDIARRIMQEFDTGKDGVLSEQEFLVLADLIVKKFAARSKEDKIVLDRYKIKRTLGHGAIGVVKLAKNLKSGKMVAIKIIESSRVSDFSKIDREIKAMLMLRHPNVVRLFKVLESNDKIYMVMELCGGGTLAEMVRIKPLSEPLARFYMRQLIPAMKYCHKAGVVHRDIKLENLLLTNRGNLKISDFGHAGIYREGWDLFSTSLVGSLWHIAPEQISGTLYKGAKIDIWALGVVLYRLLSGGRPPFYSEIASEVLDAIINARYKPLEHVSDEANDLIAKILVVDPNARPSLRNISEHPWMKFGQESVPRLEAIDLILSDSTNVEAQWQALCNACTELQVVFTVPTDRKRLLEVHRMVCHYPTAEMKFTITMLRVSEKTDDPPFFEFVIKAGETSEFQNLVDQIRKVFKIKIGDKPSTASLSKATNKSLRVSELKTKVEQQEQAQAAAAGAMLAGGEPSLSDSMSGRTLLKNSTPPNGLGSSASDTDLQSSTDVADNARSEMNVSAAELGNLLPSSPTKMSQSQLRMSPPKKHSISGVQTEQSK